MKKTSRASGKACPPSSRASGKACPPSSQEEECGVWLDTVTLRGKAQQQKQPARRRPISKLLNPSLGGGGYSVAVALNFTQTRVQMPNTKQSSISSFFTPQSRVQNQRAPSELAERDVVNSTTPSSSSSSSSSQPSPVDFGAKRTHEPDPDVLAFLNAEEQRPVHVVGFEGGGEEGVARRRHRHRERERAAENEEAPPVSPLSRGEEIIHPLGQESESERDGHEAYEDGGLETERRRSSEFSSSPPAGAERCCSPRGVPAGRLSGGPSPRTESGPAGAERGRSRPGVPAGSAAESCSQHSSYYSLQVPTTTTTARNNRRTRPHDHRDSSETGLFSLTDEERPMSVAPREEKEEGEEGFTVREGAGEERRSNRKETRGGGGGETKISCPQKPHGSQQQQEDEDDEDDEEEKENASSSPSALKPPTERSALSPPRRPPLMGNHQALFTQAMTSSWSAPPPGRPRKRAREEDDDHAYSGPGRRTRACSSPLKRAPWREPETDHSLATLFTQDSEGFRVIAHRYVGGARSPGKETSNHRTMKTSVDQEEEEEEDEEEEMLFTQDSQGNVVIKH